ncbi:sperm acrosome membrane-associated protein 4 [Carassius auratus]|uniref:Sperm acrosome membrane-associated protein 4 n=1 Tax=Carassius auratus TaxID=7957 RepID=A0A6P6RG30_CARAU|nr:prostate stem cell antigen [Carassius auratus]
MNKILLGIFAVAICFAVGQALQCYECKLGFWKFCITNEKKCNDGEHCFSGVGTAVGFMNITTKGCLELSKCNKTEQTNFTSNSQLYQLTKTCCSADLCNSAPAHFHMSAVSVAFAAISAVFTVKYLI